MAVPTTWKNICTAVAASTANGCTKLKALFNGVQAICDFRNWMMDSSGNPTDEFKAWLASIGVPTGCVVWRPTSDIPEGYLICNGAEVSRETYAALFAVYGTAFGDPSSSSVFKLPNLQGLMLVGYGNGFSLRETGGASEVTLTSADLPSHKHSIASETAKEVQVFQNAVENLDVFYVSSRAAANVQAGPSYDTTETGGGGAHDNMPPYMSGVWLVKT